jgi:hypothetical protein
MKPIRQAQGRQEARATKQIKTFTILYGLAEGPYQSQELVPLLEKRGYCQTGNAQVADILITHSGGVYLIPKTARAQTLLLVGIPCWPDRSIVSSILRKWWLEEKNVQWLQKMTYHLWYTLTGLPRLIRMYTGRRQHNLPSGAGRRVVLVRNDQDVFLHPQSALELAKKQGWDYHQLPGQHDDLWENPEPYVKLIANSVRT